jgi:16S rRNA (adenine1518-N6/adenine1519-N6)-dimethyltransferase
VGDALDELGLVPSSARGQSFLRDPKVAARQAMAASVAPGDRVLEVGGGFGMLTEELSKRGAHVRVIEIEPKLARLLDARRLKGVEVEEGDALEVDLGAPEKVVANIPYSISSELIERLVGCGASKIVLMLQEEVAERLAGEPGAKAWARLPAIVRRRYDVEVVERVPPNAFFPQPKVRSCVVRLTRRKGAAGPPDEAYAKVVGALFSMRRKKVRNTVGRAAASVGSPPSMAAAAAEAVGVAELRPEEMDVAQFEELTAQLLRARMTK